MPIDSSKLEDAIRNALVNTASVWRGRQEDALKAVIGERPLLNAMPPAFRAAAWLNTGLDATVTLFPRSMLGQAVSRLAVPLMITSLAMSAYQALYKAQTTRVNRVLHGDYRSVRNALIEKLDDAANALPAAAFGQKAKAVLRAVTERRLSELASWEMAYYHCTSILTDERHGVIETSPSEIRQRTEVGFAPLLERIKAVYDATFAPGHAVLWRVDPSREQCYRNIFGEPLRLLDPIRGEKVFCGPSQRWVSHGNMKDRPGIAEVLADIWRLEVHVDDGWTSDTTWVWPMPEEKQPKVHALVSSYEKRGLEEFKASLEQADREQWPKTQRVGSGAA